MTKTLDLSPEAYKKWSESEEGKAALASAEAPERPEGAEDEEVVEEEPEQEADEGVVDLDAREEEPEEKTAEQVAEEAAAAAAAAAAPKKVKLPRKPVVGGEEQADEYTEEELLALVQKGIDYDRPGGALQKAAERQAEARYWEHLVEAGMAVQGPDGRYYPTEKWTAYRAGETGGGQGRSASAGAQPDVDPADAKVDEELTALKAKASQTGDAEAWAAYTDRRAEVAAERATRKAERRIEERSRAATAKQTADAGVAAIQTKLEGAVDAVLAEFKDDLTDEDARGAFRSMGFALAKQAKASSPGLTADACITAGASQLRTKLSKLYEPVRNARVVLDKARAAGGTATKPKPKAAPNITGGAGSAKPIAPKPRKFDPKNPFADRPEWEARERATAARSGT